MPFTKLEAYMGKHDVGEVEVEIIDTETFRIIPERSPAVIMSRQNLALFAARAIRRLQESEGGIEATANVSNLSHYAASKPSS